jgi:7-cyano-7-deazaguanine synthase
MDKIAVIIASGGIDSTTLLYKLIHDGYQLRAVTFLYGQKHLKEANFAANIYKNLSLEYKIVDISGIKDLISGSALTDVNVNIPEVPETMDYYDTLKSTIVPNRNSIFLTLAVAYAQQLNCNIIFYGAHHSDRGVYPDCRKEFIESFEHSQRLANDNDKIKIMAPFVDMDKAEIVKIGNKLAVPYDKTWSCYKGLELHCGQCSSCRERKRAFRQSGIEDPTVYNY